ncbi:OmpA family protein [uncultured Microscilla sp.]|uniref:OmpA family protein n=1 Tax=uncultured Microscilla sp. TaxID=432653 RepID=UPI0026347066|nr:OmpA family protein [uncultured Microscilla sp.]
MTRIFSTFICLIVLSGICLNSLAQTPIESISKTYNFDLAQAVCSFTLTDAELNTSVVDSGKLIINNQTEVALRQGKGQVKLPLYKTHQINVRVAGFVDTTIVLDLTNRELGYNIQQVIGLRPQKKAFKISVQDIETNENVAVGVVLNNKNRNEKIFISAQDIRAGNYVVRIRASDTYDLEVQNGSSYAFYATTINKKHTQETKDQINIRLIPYKVGAKIPLYNITFAKKSARLNTHSFEELERVVKLLKDHPTSHILIEAHTDSDGTRLANLRLSQQRAKSVYNYLMKQGIAARRLKTRGAGELKPIVPNNTEVNKAHNRRFELIVMKK